MARQIIQQARYAGGLSYSEKEGPRSSFLWAKSMDYRTDPTKLKILPRALKVSGTVVTDLILDADREGTDTYLIGDSGNIYKRDSSEVWTSLHQAANCQGNGLKYFGEDKYLYYTADESIGRYGPFGGTKVFTDDFLGAEGGVPLNTHSLDLELSSSQYATAADHATLSITGDLTIEWNGKIESLPAVGVESTFVSKWNESGNQRSYYFGLYGISGYFGDGGDGALTIAADTTHAPVDSACTGTAAAYALTATNTSFAAGQKILIHQTRGTNAGRWERNDIEAYTAGTITTANPLANTYTSGAQVIVLKEYTNVTVDSGKTWTAKAWNGTVGGILAFLANGTVTVTGTLTAEGKGFRGGAGGSGDGYQGEGQSGTGTQLNVGNGIGGGGGDHGISGGVWHAGSAGGGGGNGGNGSYGIHEGGNKAIVGDYGYVGGSADLTTMLFGGGGGGGGGDDDGSPVGVAGKPGGGIVMILGVAVTVTGSINIEGSDYNPGIGSGAGGAGGGGSCLIKTQVGIFGTSKISAAGGDGGVIYGEDPYKGGGKGGVGRIHCDYYTSVSGTTTPTINSTQDDNLVTNVSYQLRFGLSDDGEAEEYLSFTLDPSPQTAQWYDFAVAWDASASTAYFYRDGTLLGQSVGSMTSINDSTALLGLGASFNSAGAAENFFDGKIDDIRIFNDIRTGTEIFVNKETEIPAFAGLQAYYKVNNSTADSSANSNTLTLVNAPVYDASDVPFSSPTTRNDIDQSDSNTGQTYTLTTAIDEGATHRELFTPAKDPQKSIQVNINTIGTGNWTVTVHDALNREVATKTVVAADLHTGDYEFIFTDPWRPILGATYHFHLTSTVADGIVVTGTASDLSDSDFVTYYSFLVDDAHHPIEPVLNKLAIGNERYIATWTSTGTYDPHTLTLPSGYRVRCLGTWREYLAIGTMRGTNLTDFDQGRIFFWDGNSDTYNFFIDILEGGVNAIQSGDPMYFVAGYMGDLMKYLGGRPSKVKRMPKVEGDISLEVNRKAIAMWRALTRIGFCANCSSTDVERGIYSFGSLSSEVDESLSFDYPLSLGVTTDADIEIGIVYPVGSTLIISHKKGTAYGVDEVSPSNDPYPTATCEFLITDADKIWAEKQAQVIRGYFKKLVSGDGVKAKYKIDRDSRWVEGTTTNKGYTTTANDKEVRLPLPTKGNRWNELQVAVDLETTNSDSPEFYGWGFELDDLNRERRV